LRGFAEAERESILEYSKEIKLFADCHCTLSESPMWNDGEQMLYWRGFEGELYRKAYDAPADEYERYQLHIGCIGSMVFTDAGYMLLFADGGTVWKWTPGSDPAPYRNFHKNLFNDCLVDPRGRIYCGMLAENFFVPEKRGAYGSFWRLDPDGTFICIEDKIGTTPNGIRFSPDLTKLYFGVTDSDVIYRYDYDVDTGELKNRVVYAEGCFPDGIATDAQGNVWVANCRPGAPLRCLNPAGEIVKEYDFPVHRVISVSFGGPGNASMFVTTALEGQPVGAHDGGVFVIENAARGAREFILHCAGTEAESCAR